MGQGRVTGLRKIAKWATNNPPELARQLREFEDNLHARLTQGFDVADGNQTPAQTLPRRGILELQGNVVLTTSRDRNIARILDINGATGATGATGPTGPTGPTGDTGPAGSVGSAVGYDGTNASLVGSALTVRHSRDTLSLTTNGVFNDWLPHASWPTIDIFLFTPNGFTLVRGFEAPANTNDTLVRKCWNASTSTSFDIVHDSASNTSASSRVLCPNNVDFTVRPRAGWEMLWDTTAQRWRILTPSRLSGVTGLDGVAVTSSTTAPVVQRSKVVVQVTLSADQDDWDPGDTADIIDVNPTGNWHITGMKAPTANGTTRKTLRHRGVTGSNAHYITLDHIDSGSDAENRWVCPSATDLDVLRFEQVDVIYDFEMEGWRPDRTDGIQATGTRRYIADQSHGGFGILALRDAEIEGQVGNPPAEPDEGSVILWQWANAEGNAPGYMSTMVAPNRLGCGVLDYWDDVHTGDESGTLGWDFADIDGRDLSDGTFKLRALMIAQNYSVPGSYPVVCLERWGIYTKRNVGDSLCRSMQVVGESGGAAQAYWEGNTSNDATLEFSNGAGTIVGLDWSIDSVNPAHNWHVWIIVTYEGAAHV